MLKVFGGIYGNTKEDFEALRTAIEDNGFEVAYSSDTSGTIIKEVQSLEEPVADEQ